jgi:hypothetical protein
MELKLKLIAAVGNLTIAIALCSPNLTFADNAEDLCARTGSPLLCGAIRQENDAKLRQMIREEVARQLAERDRSQLRNDGIRKSRIERDDQERQSELYRQCVQNAGVRAYLDCH